MPYLTSSHVGEEAARANGLPTRMSPRLGLVLFLLLLPAKCTKQNIHTDAVKVGSTCLHHANFQNWAAGRKVSCKSKGHLSLSRERERLRSLSRSRLWPSRSSSRSPICRHLALSASTHAHCVIASSPLLDLSETIRRASTSQSSLAPPLATGGWLLYILGHKWVKGHWVLCCCSAVLALCSCAESFSSATPLAKQVPNTVTLPDAIQLVKSLTRHLVAIEMLQQDSSCGVHCLL